MRRHPRDADRGGDARARADRPRAAAPRAERRRAARGAADPGRLAPALMRKDAASSDHAGRRLGLFFGAYFALVGILSPYMPLYFEHRGLTAVQVGVLVA